MARLITEGAGHSAARRFDRLDAQSGDQAEHFFHRGHGAESFLMAVAMQQCAPGRGGCQWQFERSLRVFLREKFLQQERTIGQRVTSRAG